MTTKKSSNGAMSLNEYKLDEALTTNRRAAHFLNWAAEEYPYQYVQYNFLLKATMGCKRTPRLDSDQVLLLRKSMTVVRGHLRKYHNRILDSEPGLGVRALVDDTDNLRVALPKQTKRLRCSKANVDRTVGMIDLKNVPDVPENRPLKTWFKSDVSSILRALNDIDFDNRALAPVKDKEPKK